MGMWFGDGDFSFFSLRCPWDVQLEMLSIEIKGEVRTEDMYLGMSSLYFLANSQSRILRILRSTYFHRPERPKSPLNFNLSPKSFSGLPILYFYSSLGRKVQEEVVFLDRKSPPLKRLLGSVNNGRMFFQGCVCRQKVKQPVLLVSRRVQSSSVLT